jgi:hypothetical protein
MRGFWLGIKKELGLTWQQIKAVFHDRIHPKHVYSLPHSNTNRLASHVTTFMPKAGPPRGQYGVAAGYLIDKANSAQPYLFGHRGSHLRCRKLQSDHVNFIEGQRQAHI